MSYNRVKFDQFGDPAKVLSFETVNGIPTPNDDEIVIKVNASPIDPYDFVVIQGTAHRALWMRSNNVQQEFHWHLLRLRISLPVLVVKVCSKNLSFDIYDILVPTNQPVKKTISVALNALITSHLIIVL